MKIINNEIELEEKLKDFLSEKDKSKIEKSLYSEDESDSYFDDIPEGEEGGELVLNKKNKSQFFAKYFKSMN